MYRMPNADSLPRRLFRRLLGCMFNWFGSIGRKPYRKFCANARTPFAAHKAMQSSSTVKLFLRGVCIELYLLRFDYSDAIALQRSSTRSSGFSSPIERRSRLFGVVDFGPSRDARCSTRLSTPPRLVALTKRVKFAATLTAASLPPASSNEIMAPPEDICRRAISWDGWLGRYGKRTRLTFSCLSSDSATSCAFAQCRSIRQ